MNGLSGRRDSIQPQNLMTWLWKKLLQRSATFGAQGTKLLEKSLKNSRPLDVENSSPQ